MKKFLPLVLSLGGAVMIGSLYAANPTPAPAAPAAAMAKPGPAEKPGLTAEQKTKIEAIRQEQRATLDAVRADQALSPADRRAKVRGLVESYRGQMKAVLTAEQQRKMAHMRDRVMDRRQQRQQRFAGPRRGPQGFGPGPQGFGFTGPQAAPQPHPNNPMEMIQQGNRMAAEGHQQLARQLGLSEEQSAKLRDLARQRQEKAQTLQKEFQDQMLGVLTPEQQEKAKAMHRRQGPAAGRPERGPGRPGPAPAMPPPGKP